MRLDLDQIAREVERKRAERREVSADQRDRRLREVERRVTFPSSDVLEGRLLVSMIFDPAVLALCDAVEADDIFDPRHRVVFRALRNLQAAGRWPSDAYAAVDAVADELDRIDQALETHLREKVSDVYLAELVSRFMWSTYGPHDAPIAAWVEHDARQLRALADRRRER